LPKSTTNRNPFASANISDIVRGGVLSSMGELRKRVRIEQQHIENAVRQFFDLFAAVALDTTAAPPLGQYTPHFAALSSGYAQSKASGAGFFRNTGTLISDVKALSGNATNILGKSSSTIEPKFSGARKGFSLDSANPLRVRNTSTGAFASPVQGLKNFRVEVTHTPFSKVRSGFRPEQLEADIFKGAYNSIYNKLTNQQPEGRTRHYRSAFYSFMQWWLNEHLKEVIR